jgi:hypothetical protein
VLNSGFAQEATWRLAATDNICAELGAGCSCRSLSEVHTPGDRAVHHRLMPVVKAEADRHVRAFGRQRVGNGAADAALAAGDDGATAFQPQIHQYAFNEVCAVP